MTLKMFVFISCLCLAVSTFDPDNNFTSNVLSKLEAAMAIEIISVLAKNCSQLSTISGVKLREQVDSQGHRISLADPQRAPGKICGGGYFSMVYRKQPPSSNMEGTTTSLTKYWTTRIEPAN